MKTLLYNSIAEVILEILAVVDQERIIIIIVGKASQGCFFYARQIKKDCRKIAFPSFLQSGLKQIGHDHLISKWPY